MDDKKEVDVEVKEVIEKKIEEQEREEAKEEAPKVSLEKGFVVGFTADGMIKLQPFGKINDLELVGLIQYAKTKGFELLSKIARTSISDIPALKEGVTVLAHGIKALLAKEEAKKEE